MKRKQEYISLARELAESSIVVDALSRLIEQIVSEVYASAAKKKADLKEEIKRVKKESAQWEFAAGQSFVRAEQAEDRAEAAERERDIAEARYSASTLRAAGAESALNAAERKVEMLREVLGLLVALKKERDDLGKTQSYQERKEQAWCDARDALKETGPENGEKADG